MTAREQFLRATAAATGRVSYGPGSGASADLIGGDLLAEALGLLDVEREERQREAREHELLRQRVADVVDAVGTQTLVLIVGCKDTEAREALGALLHAGKVEIAEEIGPATYRLKEQP